MPIVHFINCKSQTAGGMKNVLGYISKEEKTKVTPHIWLPSKRNMKKHSAESRVHIEMFNLMFTGYTESD